jgi:hypothetical protein
MLPTIGAVPWASGLKTCSGANGSLSRASYPAPSMVFMISL